MRRLFFAGFPGGTTGLGLLLVRLATGAAFIMHGLPKIQNPTGWMPGGAVPGYLQLAAAVAEFGGGIALIVGLLTPVATLLLIGTMCVAIFQYHIPQGHPFVAVGKPSFELALAYLANSLLLLLAGPGKLSLDALFFGRGR